MAKTARKRDGRIPLHKQKHSRIDKRQGYVRRWVNDTGTQIKDFERAGWGQIHEDVKNGTPTGSHETAQEGKLACMDVGGGIKAICMEIPEKYYKEDQEEKQAECDRIMGQIENGIVGGTQKGMIANNVMHSDLKVNTSK